MGPYVRWWTQSDCSNGALGIVQHSAHRMELCMRCSCRSILLQPRASPTASQVCTRQPRTAATDRLNSCCLSRARLHNNSTKGCRRSSLTHLLARASSKGFGSKRQEQQPKVGCESYGSRSRNAERTHDGVKLQAFMTSVLQHDRKLQ